MYYSDRVLRVRNLFFTVYALHKKVCIYLLYVNYLVIPGWDTMKMPIVYTPQKCAKDKII